MRLTRDDRRLLWVVGAALLFSYAYFYQAGGWNQNSRFALVRAILEHHTLRIDEYHHETGDRAVWRGHYYSDKAPGASFVALIPVDAARAVGFILGVNPESDAGIAWTSYVATVATSGVFTAAAALSLIWVSLFWGYSRGAALFAATAYGLASPAWCYATLFMGHGLTAGSLALAFAAAVGLGHSSDARRRRLEWLVGLFGGCAMVSEFPAAVPVALIVALALLTVRAADPRALPGAIVRIVAGGGVWAMLLFAYDTAAFGSPFHLGYASEEGFEQLRTGLFGITYPAWWRVREILVGAYRGLLPISPLLALTPIGLYRLTRRDDHLRPALVGAGIAIFYLALNASYFYWEGGWAFGPRHVMAALPFLALGLAPLWDGWPAIGRASLMAGWVWGVAITLMGVSTTPQPPASIERPVSQLMMPAFRAGELALNTQRFTDFRADQGAIERFYGPRAGWNLGMKMGLNGRASLVPLGLVWCVVGGWLMAAGAGERAASAGSGSTSSLAPRGSV
jgi:hypothetical protein